MSQSNSNPAFGTIQFRIIQRGYGYCSPSFLSLVRLSSVYLMRVFVLQDYFQLSSALIKKPVHLLSIRKCEDRRNNEGFNSISPMGVRYFKAPLHQRESIVSIKSDSGRTFEELFACGEKGCPLSYVRLCFNNMSRYRRE